jgi:hypothetical protein
MYNFAVDGKYCGRNVCTAVTYLIDRSADRRAKAGSGLDSDSGAEQRAEITNHARELGMR